MPIVSNSFAAPTPTLQSSADQDAVDAELSAARPGFLGGLLGSVALSPFDLVDTTISSIPFSPYERGDFNRGVIEFGAKMLPQAGAAGLRRFAEEQQGATEIISGLEGILVADKIAARVFATSGPVMRGIRQLPAVKRISALDHQYDLAFRAASTGMREAAARGEMGSNAFKGVLNYQSLGVKTRLDLGKARQGVVWTDAGRGAARALGTEVVMAGMLNTNSIFFTDDWTENLVNASLGIGIGGLIGYAQGGWALRRAANSTAIEREMNHAFDPQNYNRGRSKVGSVADAEGKSWLGYDHELESNFITSQILQAQDLRLPTPNTERGKALFSNRATASDQLLGAAYTNANKVTIGGLNRVTGTGFNDKSPAMGALKEGWSKDPTLIYGASEVGVPNGWDRGPDGLGIWGTDATRKAAIDKRQDEIGKIFKNGGIEKLDKKTGQTIIEPLEPQQLDSLRVEMRKLIQERSYVGVVQLTPGELAPIEFGKVVDGFVERPVRPSTKAGKTIWESSIEQGSNQKIMAVGDDLTIYTEKNTPISHVSMHDSLQFWRVARKATDRLAEGPKVVTLPQKPNWAQLDMAERIIQLSGNPAKVTFPNGMSREDALVESFAQKVDAIRGIASKAGQSRGPFGKGKFPELNDVDAFALRIRFNLPSLSPMETGLLHSSETPIDDILRAFQDGDEVRKGGYAGLKKAIEDASQIRGLPPETATKFGELRGQSFDFMLTAEGKPLTPVMMYKRPMMPDDWTRRALDESIMTRKAYQRSLLVGDTADPIMRAMAQTLLESPDFQQALKVSELADFQHQSWLPGLVNQAPQSFFGAMTDAFNFGGREFRDRDNLTMLAAQRIKDLSDRITREGASALIKDTYGDILSRVAAPRAGESRIMLSHFFAQRSGWDLVERTLPNGEIENAVKIALPNGKPGFAFKLDDTTRNHERFELQFGQPMDKDQLMLNAQGKPIVLDELGMEALGKWNQLTEAKRSQQNTLLRAKGLPEIERMVHWVPSESMQGKLVAFTFDANNKAVPGWRISAHTEEELKTKIRQAESSADFQPGWTVRSRDNVTAHMDLYDKAQMDWYDASSTPVVSGRVNKGGLATQEIDLKAWERANAQLLDGFIENGSDLLKTLMKDSLDHAHVMAEVGRRESRIGRSSQSKYNGIFDRYLQNATGRAASANREGFISPYMQRMGEQIDEFLRDRTPGTAKVFGAAQDYFRKVNPFARSDTNQELFDKLVKDFGPYMPFDSAAKFVEAQTGAALPKEIKQISAKISWMESTSKLRWFESVHALMNFGSLIHNMPAVVKGIQRIDGESMEQWNKRIGHVGSIFGNQNPVAVVNPAKLIFKAFKESWKPTHDEFTIKAFARGFMDQEVAELERQWNSIKTNGDIKKWFFGNPHVQVDPSAPLHTRIGQHIQKQGGLDYYLGYMSDKSEAYSRRVGMYFGRELAKLHGINRVDDQVAFAHDMTNKLIANYDPRNRPEIFQGWLGAPIGLFQSYVTNYYSRMFRLFETANYRTLASQALWQSSIFGIKSFGPFWDQANSMFFDRGGVLTEEATDSFEKRLGTTDADLLMYGVLSNLPKMFGGEGASVYTRGDINVRLPVVNMPVADSVARIWNGISTGWDAVWNNTEGLTAQQGAEILSNMLGNRPIAGLIEATAAGGYDTAKTGETVSKSIRDQDDNFSLLNLSYRLAGIKSMAQQKEIDSFYADKTAQEEQAARQTTLRLETRANIRAGNFDVLPDLFVKYVENGGDLKYFTRWYNDMMSSSLDSRSQRRLNDLMKNDKKMASVNRLLDAGVRPKNEDDADDYGAAEERKTAIKARVDELLSVSDDDSFDDEDEEE